MPSGLVGSGIVKQFSQTPGEVSQQNRRPTGAPKPSTSKHVTVGDWQISCSMQVPFWQVAFGRQTVPSGRGVQSRLFRSQSSQSGSHRPGSGKQVPPSQIPHAPAQSAPSFAGSQVMLRPGADLAHGSAALVVGLAGPAKASAAFGPAIGGVGGGLAGSALAGEADPARLARGSRDARQGTGVADFALRVASGVVGLASAALAGGARAAWDPVSEGPAGENTSSRRTCTGDSPTPQIVSSAKHLPPSHTPQSWPQRSPSGWGAQAKVASQMWQGWQFVASGNTLAALATAAPPAARLTVLASPADTAPGRARWPRWPGSGSLLRRDLGPA